MTQVYLPPPLALKGRGSPALARNVREVAEAYTWIRRGGILPKAADDRCFDLDAIQYYIDFIKLALDIVPGTEHSDSKLPYWRYVANEYQRKSKSLWNGHGVRGHDGEFLMASVLCGVDMGIIGKRYLLTGERVVLGLRKKKDFLYEPPANKSRWWSVVNKHGVRIACVVHDEWLTKGQALAYAREVLPKNAWGLKEVRKELPEQCLV
jgi:hypothetical protein